jgi:hypothetical protein
LIAVSANQQRSIHQPPHRCSSRAVCQLTRHIVRLTKYQRKTVSPELLEYLRQAFDKGLTEWRCAWLGFGGEANPVQRLADIHPALNISTLSSRAPRFAALGVHGGRQGQGAVAVVLEAVSLSAPRRQRQHGVESVPGLNSGFPVDTEDRRMGRRMQIEPNHIGGLGFDLGIVRTHWRSSRCGGGACLAHTRDTIMCETPKA